MEKRIDKKNGDAQKNDKENIVAIFDSDMNVVYDERFVNLTCHTSDWMIDSGSWFHVTTHRELLLKMSDMCQIFTLI